MQKMIITRSNEEVQKYLEEAYDKVWYCTSQVCDIDILEQKRLEEVKRLIDKYSFDELEKLKDPVKGDYKYGYLTGVLSALEWLGGKNKDSQYDL